MRLCARSGHAIGGYLSWEMRMAYSWSAAVADGEKKHAWWEVRETLFKAWSLFDISFKNNDFFMYLFYFR